MPAYLSVRDCPLPRFSSPLFPLGLWIRAQFSRGTSRVNAARIIEHEIGTHPAPRNPENVSINTHVFGPRIGRRKDREGRGGEGRGRGREGRMKLCMKLCFSRHRNPRRGFVTLTLARSSFQCPNECEIISLVCKSHAIVGRGDGGGRERATGGRADARFPV